MYKKKHIIDCHNLIAGRLSASVAKGLLNGNRYALLRAENSILSGRKRRTFIKFQAFLHKKSNTNPRRSSHIHYREPSNILKRMIRGMLPHKTHRGAQALKRLEVYEGVPTKYEKKKRLVIPSAVKAICLKNHRFYCKLGDLSNRFGWKHQQILSLLEDKRKARSDVYYKQKLEQINLMNQAKAKAFNSLSLEDQQILERAGKI